MIVEEQVESVQVYNQLCLFHLRVEKTKQRGKAGARKPLQNHSWKVLRCLDHSK